MSHPCGCCKAQEIKGPYLGTVEHALIQYAYFQCWNDWNGKRCENTRVVARTIDSHELLERLRKAGLLT